VVLTGANVGRVFKITTAAVTLGRSQQCGFRVFGMGVSRVHAKIVQLKDGGLEIRDQNSSNGTFVNDQRIEQCALNNGDRIRLGDTLVLKFTMQDELEEIAQQQLYEAAMRDALTGAHNRRYFEEELVRAVSHAARHASALSLVLLDIDYFKNVNDTFGHQAGDMVLQSVAAHCRSTMRNEDVLCRVGGEEFAVIARSIPVDRAVLLAERLRARVAGERFKCGANDVTLTLSLGVASYAKGALGDAQAIVAAADRALYRAKESGRNRVCAVDASGTLMASFAS
jgi:diguanylate cyclase (GGDEF)-like protein